MSWSCEEAYLIDGVDFYGRRFCASIGFTGDNCTFAAPILKWLRGKSRAQIRSIAKRRQWRVLG